MNEPITEQLLLDALEAAGLRDRELGHRVVTATLASLFQRLTTDERATFARCLSTSLIGQVPKHRATESFDAEELYRRIAQRARTDTSRAREHAQVVIATLGQRASYEVLRKLSHAFPPEIAALLDERETGQPPPHVETKPAAQAHSVVREDNPHGDRKLSSGRPNLRPSEPVR